MSKKWRRFRKRLKLQLSFAKRRLVKPSLPKNRNGKVLVHIGCGKIDSPEFINVDALPLAHIHIVTDNITCLPDFEEGTVDLIYMCHILEHIKRNNLKDVLLEMRRALKDDGILRLSVPNFDKLIDVYKASGKDINRICRQLMGGQDYEYNIHYSIFNPQYLSELLKEVGFKKIVSWDPDNCQYHNFKDCAAGKIKVDGKGYPISLNLEATK
jgi:predicted SAM-dependent methyltransferase